MYKVSESKIAEVAKASAEVVEKKRVGEKKITIKKKKKKLMPSKTVLTFLIN